MFNFWDFICASSTQQPKKPKPAPTDFDSKDFHDAMAVAMMINDDEENDNG